MTTTLDSTKPRTRARTAWALVVCGLLVAALPGAWPDAWADASPEKPTILITGANTGHGLAFAEEYAALGWKVIATCRTPARADKLNALAARMPNVVVEQLDIVDDDKIRALADKYRGQPIDVLMHNAAINTFRFGAKAFGDIDYEWFEEILIVNIIGPMKVSEAFESNVAASRQKKIIARPPLAARLPRSRCRSRFRTGPARRA